MKKTILFLILLCVIHSGTVQASSLTGRNFMKLSEGQRHWWYVGVYTVLGHVMLYNDDEKKADCVWRWFFDDPDRREKQLVKSLELYPDHAPTSIVMSLLRRDCGVFPKE